MIHLVLFILQSDYRNELVFLIFRTILHQANDYITPILNGPTFCEVYCLCRLPRFVELCSIFVVLRALCRR